MNVSGNRPATTLSPSKSPMDSSSTQTMYFETTANSDVVIREGPFVLPQLEY